MRHSNTGSLVNVKKQIKKPAQEQAIGTTYGIRTRDSSVKGRRLNPLTNAAFLLREGKDKCFYMNFLSGSDLRIFCSTCEVNNEFLNTTPGLDGT